MKAILPVHGISLHQNRTIRRWAIAARRGRLYEFDPYQDGDADGRGKVTRSRLFQRREGL
jgi:hypothetical protein